MIEHMRTDAGYLVPCAVRLPCNEGELCDHNGCDGFKACSGLIKVDGYCDACLRPKGEPRTYGKPAHVGAPRVDGSAIAAEAFAQRCERKRTAAPELTTVRDQPAADAALAVLCELTDLDAALVQLAGLSAPALASFVPDARLQRSLLDLLAAMHSVKATLGTDLSIFDRATGRCGEAGCGARLDGTAATGQHCPEHGALGARRHNGVEGMCDCEAGL